MHSRNFRALAFAADC